MSSKFNSKVLLFGEYGVIHGSDALAIPFDNFSGTLTFDQSYDIKSNRDLKSFANYLAKYTNDADDFKLDIEALKFDINQGLVFKSSIPQGYGLGSSGALCANVFHRYNMNGISREEVYSPEVLIRLKKYFGLMESHFHGKSSGFEPLVSYFSRAILYKDASTLNPVELPNMDKYKFFIVDTGRGRSTEPLVNLYFEKLKTPEFKEICEVALKQNTNACIDSFLKSDFDALFGLFSELSHIQNTHFLPMIPPLYRTMWEEGLNSDLFRLKLCGAGGGGFLLGLTRDVTAMKAKFSNESLRFLNI